MISAIKERRSIRKFNKDVLVTKEQLERLLEAAMLAPSACNTRPWEFIAITNREMLDEIAEIHPWAKMCETAAAAIVMVLTPPTDPDVALDYYPQDGGAATQNILLEAVEMGLGACWCGVYPKPPLMEAFAEKFGIKEPSVPFNVIAIGTPAERPKARGSYEASKVTFIE